MKQDKDSLLEINANGGESHHMLTTDMSSHNDNDPAQSVRTLGGLTADSTMAGRMPQSQNNQERELKNGGGESTKINNLMEAPS